MEELLLSLLIARVRRLLLELSRLRLRLLLLLLKIGVGHDGQVARYGFG